MTGIVLNRKALKNQAQRLKKSEISETISRKCLCFSKDEISFYLWVTLLFYRKKHKNITKRDFDIHRVTKRKTEYICGYKGLVFLNRQGFIIDCEFLNINISDYNILKKTRKI